MSKFNIERYVEDECPASEKEAQRRKEEMARLAAARKKRITIIGVLASITAIAVLVVVTTVIIPGNNYKKAAAHEAAIAPFKKVGSYVTFGNYEQDNNTGNGKEAIEWLVLDVQGDKALLISRYALVYETYNMSDTDVTWETCSLRTWMNRDFISNAFTAEEQKAVLTTTVDNSKSQGYFGTNGENNTQDKVFLLSYAEAGKYFKNDDARKCQPTKYAAAQNKERNDNCWWWLRSLGSHSITACRVDGDGVCGDTAPVDFPVIAVRPAFWLDLTSDIF